MTMPLSISAAKNPQDAVTFENFDDGKVPWDIGKPQEPFIDLADRIFGSILDAGCGTGEHALFFAARETRLSASTSLKRRSTEPGPRRRSGA